MRPRCKPVVLVLFDLDGFKHYNDTFGHPAGDALLTRLGGSLARVPAAAAAPRFRMGGDEFCALLRPGDRGPSRSSSGPRRRSPSTARASRVGCSYGAIELPLEAANVADALRIADQRMYAQKNAGRSSASRQSKDVLLRALAERNPDQGSRLGGVADLAEATALLLALGHDEVEQVRHAAELHDVGKVAVPDAILAKPGPLTEEEWGFIRRHTIIGQRIIGAAPALARVARLVRHSHERWDGTGYPDALAGSDIPLGARIVAVADAFDAMTSARPYSPPRSPEAAMEELERCAGTQFDPAVVAAFAIAWSDRALAAAA